MNLHAGSRIRWISHAAILLTVMASCASVAFGAGESVEDFLKKKSRWNKLVGLRFRIEGRLATGAGTTLKLAKLPLLFVSQKELPELSGPDLVVEVVGELQRGPAGVLEFQLISVQKTESDLERLNRIRVDLPRNEPGPWYDLGDWAMHRVAFYQSGNEVDRKLRQEARELYRMALRKERTAMKDADYNLLKKLADKTDDYGLAGEMRLPLLYEAHLQAWDRIRSKGGSEELATVAFRVASELPGARDPADEPEPDEVAEWRISPLAYYQAAPESLRPFLHRLLYQQIMLQSIEKKAAPDGKNGREIAEEVELRIPELNSVAAKYRQMEQVWRISHVVELPREEVLALQKELAEEGREEEGDQVFKRWFKQLEIELEAKGAEGLAELASAYEDLLDDSETAVQLLLKAERIKPGISYISDRLEAYGYRQINGSWKRADEAGPDRSSPIEIAMRQGRVIRGMTSQQVQKTLGVPDRVTRVMTSRSVIEYWVYSTSSRSGMSIRIARPINRKEGIVRMIFELSSSASSGE